MNSPPPSILPRAAARALSRALQVSPICVVLGARQTGKTTLLNSMSELSNHAYLTLDDFDLRIQANADPESILARAPMLILDEVQRCRDLLLAVKQAVDQTPTRVPGRFVLTGSANLLMLERISETLAGRAIYVSLWPFTRRERLGLGEPGIWTRLLAIPSREWTDLLTAEPAPPEDWRIAAKLGGMPVPSHVLTDDAQRSLWFSGYVQTYLERDLQSLRAVENLADFRRLMRAACLRLGAIINQT